MKRIFILVLAVGMLAVFASVAAAQKSVVAIVKATTEDAKLLDGNFKIQDLVALDATEGYDKYEGDVTRAIWDLES